MITLNLSNVKTGIYKLFIKNAHSFENYMMRIFGRNKKRQLVLSFFSICIH